MTVSKVSPRFRSLTVAVLRVVPGTPARLRPASDGCYRQFPTDFESGGRVFESPRARHSKTPVGRAEAARDAGFGRVDRSRDRGAGTGQIGWVVVHGVVPGARTEVVRRSLSSRLPDVSSTPAASTT